MADVEKEMVWLLIYLLGYCGIHSALASLGCKRAFARRWPHRVPLYRLGFNLQSLVLLLPLLWFESKLPAEPLWQWPSWLRWGLNGIALLAVGCFIHSLRSYDTGVFSGLRQWRHQSADIDDNEPLHIGFWHRFVRHPWYFFILVVLWTREMNLFQLAVYGVFSLYLVIGSRLEERKLMVRYGSAYRDYRHRVPGLLPLPWRWLTAGQARVLAAMPARVAPKKACGQ